ncbi:MAG: type II toxin-antitoxin system RatA family toxin [Deltaproteobacteria bacterium]
MIDATARVFASAAALLVASLTPAFAFAPEDRARLDAGEPVVRVVPGKGGPIDGQVNATMVIPAPAAAVYSALTECANAPEVFPSLKSCRVIETGPQAVWDVREHKVASWASFLPDMSTVFRSEYVPNRSISFKLLSGDIQHLDGAWTLEPVNGGTRVTYEARVGFHALVPSFLVRQSLAADVPKFMAAIREESVRRAPRFAKQN